MALTSGTRLGPYEIVSPLGAGGMGEVYRANDARLNRTVAIKILSDESAADADRRERFEREAKAISALDHPNICALYDVGEHQGTYFLVMPCLEGQTLADRLAKGALPPDQAIKYAIEIATALDAAHRHGIIHRDLKPGNIMLTKTGVKLLDFGLAKLKQASGTLTYSGLAGNTTKAPGTGVGTLLGTMPYMAPEQVEGRDVDARSDIFSLGAVIYEMVTGERAFKGESPASVMGAILKDEPAPMKTVQPLTPAALDHVVTTCLAKDPDERWQSTADIGRELKWIASAGADANVTRLVRRRSLLWPAAIAAIVLAAIGAITWPALRPASVTSDVIRLSILPPPNGKFSTPAASVVAPQVAISPDGRLVAFVAESAGVRPHVWVRSLNTLEPTMLPGTTDALYPFWSPDGRSIGFFAQGKLRTINLAGGPATTLSDSPLDSRGGSWSRDGTIIFARAATDVIYRVAATGGPVTSATRFDAARKENSHRFPTFLPNSRYLTYVVRSELSENWGVAIASLDSVESRFIGTGLQMSAQAANPATLLSLRGSTLLAFPFDLNSFRFSAEGLPLADNIGVTSTAYGSFSASESGNLVYGQRPRLAGELRWFTRNGTAQDTVTPLGEYLDFELSPDERTLAFSLVDDVQSMGDVWTMDLQGRVASRITNDPMNDASVIWSPDGSQLIFRSNRHGNSDIYRTRASGTSREELWLANNSNLILTDWSASNGQVVLTNIGQASGFDIWAWDRAAGSTPKRTIQTRANAAHGKVSPDGRWLAYASDESGQWQVYVQPFPPSGEKKQISAGGGSEPRWRHDGRELFFLSAAHEMMSVPIPGGDASAAGVPSVLFQTRVPLTANVYRSNYVVSRDGQRFLVNVSSGQAMTEPLTLILNWPALLRSNSR